MSIFTITRTTRHFYLNYHHAGSNSLWIHSAFMRYFQFSLREVICFLSVSFLAYGTRIADYLSLEYLLPIISILCLQETFGSTLFFAYQITLTITPLALFLFAVQKIGLNYHNYLATELLILLPTTFLISYSCTEVNIIIPFIYACFMKNKLWFRFKQKNFPYFIMHFILQHMLTRMNLIN